MKKFLTVLLVIAVMFTFSFSSAFADVATAEQKQAITSAEAYALNAVKTTFETAYAELAAADITDGTYSPIKAATVATNKDAAWAEMEKNIKEITTAAIGNVPGGVTASKTARENAEAIYATYMVDVDALKTIIKADAGLVLTKAQYAADVKAETDKLDSINTSRYASKFAARINAYVAKLKKDIADETKTAETTNTADAYKTAIGKAKTTTGVLQADKYDDTVIDNGLYVFTDAGLNAELAFAKTTDASLTDADKIKSQAAVDQEAAVSAAGAAAVKAEVAAKVAASTATKEEKDAYTTVYNYLADNGIVTKTSDVKDVGTPAYATVVAEIEGLKTYAEKYKAEKDAQGKPIRDAATVDKIVADTTKYIYAKAQNSGTTVTATYTTVEAAKKAIAQMNAAAAAAELDFAKKVRVAALEKAKADAEKDYYPAEYAKVAAKYDEVIAKVNAADTVAKTKAAATPDPDLTGIATKTYVDTDTAKDGSYKAAKDAVTNYLAYVNTGKSVTDSAYITPNPTKIEKALKKLYGESGARTENERKAVAVDPAKIVAENLATVGEVDAAYAAAKTAINVLPATVTAADKDAVQAAQDAADAYEKVAGAAIKGAEGAKLAAAKDALYNDINKTLTIKTAQVDKKDKAALKALKEEIEEANKLTEADALLAGETPIPTNAIDKALTAIQAAEKKAVLDAINAIPLNVTEADRAKVEEARKLYDAYVAEYTTIDPANDAAKDAGLPAALSTLAAAETILGLNTPDPAKKVESVKITASSKATKGAITVKWTIKGSKSSVKGFQIWRSTKKNTGFKKMFTTKKYSYKNTKGLKKGVTYYYKVRAYSRTEDGKLLFSDWSNKAYRKAK